MKPNTKLSAFSIYLSSLLQFGITIIQGFLLVPLYLEYFGTTLYGFWLALAPIVAWMTVADPGFADIIRGTVSNAFGAQSRKEIGGAIGSWMLFQLLVAPIPLIIAYFLAPFLPGILGAGAQDSSLLQTTFLVFCATTTLALVNGALGGVLQGIHYGTRFAIIQTLANLTGLAVTIVTMFYGLSILSIPLGLLVRQMLNTLFFLLAVTLFLKRERIQLKISKDCFRDISSLSPVILINKITSVIFRNIETFIITLLYGAVLNPVFVLTGRVLSLVGPLTGGAAQALMPSLSHLWGEKDREEFLAVSQKLFSFTLYLLTFISILFLGLNESFVSLWVGDSLFGGSLLSFLLLLSYTSDTVWYALFQVILATGQYRGVYWNGAILNTVRGLSMLLLLKLLGLPGLPLGVIATNSVIGIAYLLPQYYRLFSHSNVLQKEIIKKFTKKTVILCGGMILGSLIKFNTSNHLNWYSFFSTAILYTFLSGIYLLVFDNDFRKLASTMVTRYLPKNI